MLPGAPQQVVFGHGHAHRERSAVQLGEHAQQRVLEPGMQDRMRDREHSLGAHCAGRRAQQRQQLGRPAADVLMGPGGGMARGMPGLPRLGNGLLGAGFVLAPQRHAAGFCLGVGRRDQRFSPRSWGPGP
jgi:hypothetical protein